MQAYKPGFVFAFRRISTIYLVCLPIAALPEKQKRAALPATYLTFQPPRFSFLSVARSGRGLLPRVFTLSLYC